jgi:prepilin-type N-terminal cleavage/methylation domain-containing protein
MLCTQGRQAFTLIELLVVIAIVGFLFLFAIAPYTFYSNTSKVRLSVDRVEQEMSKAKLLVSTGFAPNGANVDLVLRIGQGASSITLDSIPVSASGSAPLPLGDPQRKSIDRVPLDAPVLISGFLLSGGTSTTAPASIDIVYRSPNGSMEVWDSSSAVSTRIISDIQGVVGVKGAMTGSLSRSFMLRK